MCSEQLWLPHAYRSFSSCLELCRLFTVSGAIKKKKKKVHCFQLATTRRDTCLEGSVMQVLLPNPLPPSFSSSLLYYYSMYSATSFSFQSIISFSCVTVSALSHHRSVYSVRSFAVCLSDVLLLIVMLLTQSYRHTHTKKKRIRTRITPETLFFLECCISFNSEM